jgi:hypothetical protein
LLLLTVAPEIVLLVAVVDDDDDDVANATVLAVNMLDMIKSASDMDKILFIGFFDKRKLSLLIPVFSGSNHYDYYKL